MQNVLLISECDDLELSVEDKTEEAHTDAFFNGEPRCTIGLKKSACWHQFGKEKVVVLGETMDMEKEEVDIAILAELRVMRGEGPSDHSVINYQFFRKPICKAMFLFMHNTGA